MGYQVYEALSKVPNGLFTIAAAFGNAQKYISEKLDLPAGSKPVKFVFHGGSGSSVEDIRYAIKAGVVKTNIDTDTQWAFWDGVRQYEAKHHDFLQGQIGNPDGEDKPNKKYYDPRMMLRAGEQAMADRLVKSMEDLFCV